MTVQIIRGNALDLPLADDSVDLVVTSPPYFGLRSYQDGGEHYDGQIGDEATPAEFVDALVAATAEMVRVVKPTGSIFVNLGDKYAADGRATRPQGTSSARLGRSSADAGVGNVYRYEADVRPKSLMGIPWRYALRCIDDLGLILRAEIIWSKPNGLPESVTDRVRRSHEQWFCFQQSGGVEAAAESFPFCPLCGRPVDARSTLIRRLKECDGGVEPVCMSDEVGTDVRSEPENARGRHDDVAVGPLVPPVPSLDEGHVQVPEDAAHLVQDGVAAVVDGDAENGAALSADEGHRALPVDDSGKPSDVCECEGHALTIDDEPWIPQSLAAEIMQRVAGGEIDPQQAADFLSGDYVRNHSVWFHFTLSPRYYSAVDEIREEHAPQSIARSQRNRFAPDLTQDGVGSPNTLNPSDACNPLGKLPGSVWTIPTEPLHVPESLGVDHFAAFPTEWPRRIVQGWSPAGICVECGEGRRPVAASTNEPNVRLAVRTVDRAAMSGGTERSTLGRSASTVITGEACACPEPTAPTRPGVVLDPFGGTGTTALVADALGRHGISVDMSRDYCRLATWRTTDPKQRAKAARREYKPPTPQLDGQLDLLEGLGA